MLFQLTVLLLRYKFLYSTINAFSLPIFQTVNGVEVHWDIAVVSKCSQHWAQAFKFSISHVWILAAAC